MAYINKALTVEWETPQPLTLHGKDERRLPVPRGEGSREDEADRETAVIEQLRLDLFPKPERDHVAEWRKWLQEPFNDVNDEGLEVFDRLLERFPRGEAFDRSKCLDVTHGKRKVDGLTVDDLGLFTAEDYHICWDRAWAAKNGYAPEQVREMMEWDYRKKEPIYAVPDGHKVL